MRMARNFSCIGALGLLGFLASCSDPVPPASQGSASFHFGGPSPAAALAGKQCPAGVHYSDAPSTLTSPERTSGSTRPKDTVIDGEKSRTFHCSVVPSGDKFAVKGDMNVPAFDKDMKPLIVPTQLTLDTTIGTDEGGATGSVSVSDDATGGPFYLASDCVFSVQKNATTNTKLAVAAGKIWGSVTCTNLALPTDPNSSCTVDIGYFILENCDQ